MSIRHFYWSLILLTPILAGATGIYKTVDQDGKIIYTDVPADATSEELKLPKGNTIPGLEPDPNKSYRKVHAPSPYKLKITAPENDSTHFITETSLAIRVRVTPPFTGENGSTLQIFLNDKLLTTGDHTNLLLADMERGAYTVTARIVDKQRKSIASSEPVTFHIKKPVIPANSTAPKPKKGK